MNQATLRTYFRVTSVAVWLVALAFALNFCLGQLFPDARAQIWLVMDPLMGASIIVSLIAQWVSIMRRTSSGLEDWRCAASVAALCLTTVLIVLFFWNFIDYLAAGPGGQSEMRLVMWAIISPFSVGVTCATGAVLWHRVR